MFRRRWLRPIINGLMRLKRCNFPFLFYVYDYDCVMVDGWIGLESRFDVFRMFLSVFLSLFRM